MSFFVLIWADLQQTVNLFLTQAVLAPAAYRPPTLKAHFLSAGQPLEAYRGADHSSAGESL